MGTAAALAGLMVLGSLYACAISMLWPERRPPAPRAARPRPVAPMLDYGVRLGAAGASAAAIGFALDLDHVGWACAAALLVMRPAAEMQRLRKSRVALRRARAGDPARGEPRLPLRSCPSGACLATSGITQLQDGRGGGEAA